MSEPRSTLNRAVAEAGQTIRIADRGPVGQISLRGDLSSVALKVALKSGIDVPGPLRAAFNGDNGAVWMSPDELLLFTTYDQAEALADKLGALLASGHFMALNVSDARAVISLTGVGVADVLAKGAPVDLSEAAFPVGTARRTHIGGVAVGFWRRSADEWEIVCFRSFAQYLFDWLVESSNEGSEIGFF